MREMVFPTNQPDFQIRLNFFKIRKPTSGVYGDPNPRITDKKFNSFASFRNYKIIELL